jgi:hypothetical protein
MPKMKGPRPKTGEQSPRADRANYPRVRGQAAGTPLQRQREEQRDGGSGELVPEPPAPAEGTKATRGGQ